MKSKEPSESVPATSEPKPEGYALSQRAAEICKEIVETTAMVIENKKYVSVEGWQAIAIAHGCVASAGDVVAEYQNKVLMGYRAVGEVRRMDTGVMIAHGEGFVGVDEVVWFGGQRQSYGKLKTYYPRPAYACRAMAQTRAISRACRSAFAHVVVIINRELSTTPAEEMEHMAVETSPPAPEPAPPPVQTPAERKTSMMDEARAMSAEQGYPPGAKPKGAYRRVGTPPSQADLEKKKIAQLDAAYDWIKDQKPTLEMMTPQEIEQWKENAEIAPRYAAIKQGGEQQPGYEHLGPAWDYLQQVLDQIRKPV